MNKEAIYKFLEQAKRNEWVKFFCRERIIEAEGKKFHFWIPFWRRYSLFTSELRRKFGKDWRDVYDYLKLWKVFIEEYRGKKLYIRNTIKETRFYVAWFTGSKTTYRYPRCIFIHYYNPFLSIPDLSHGFWLLEKVCEWLLNVDFDEMENWHDFDKAPNTIEDADFRALKMGLEDMKRAEMFLEKQREIEIGEEYIHISAGWTGRTFRSYPHIKNNKIYFEWVYMGYLQVEGVDILAKGLISWDGIIYEVQPKERHKKGRKSKKLIFDVYDEEIIKLMMEELKKLRDRIERGEE